MIIDQKSFNNATTTASDSSSFPKTAIYRPSGNNASRKQPTTAKEKCFSKSARS